MPRMRSPQELLRDSRRELLSRSPHSSSPLKRSEPIALVERGRTCGLFFRPLRNRPRSNRPRRNSHSLRQPPSPRAVTRTLPSPQQPPLPAAIIPYCNRTARHRPHAALRRAVTRTLPSTAPATPARCRPRSNRPRRDSHSLRQPPHEARIHPSRCGCFTASPGKNRTVCVLFSMNARNKPSPWQCLPKMYAFRDRNGKILALCVHFQVQSGGFGYMA